MKPKSTAFMFLFSGAASLATLTSARAADDAPATGQVDSYAVVALVGDAFTVVAYQPSVGSNLDRNNQQRVPVGSTHFDDVATRVAINAIRRHVPGATPQPVALADSGTFGGSSALFDADDHLPALLAAVRPLLAQPDTHYLVVISKFRGDARLKVSNGSIGSGKLSGLGFYVDAYKGMRSTRTGEVGRGFIAPYAYVMVSLVDLRTGAVVRSEPSIETTTRANTGSQSTLEPWDAVSAEEKAALLDDMLRRAVQKAVPHVVAPS